ncbi:TolC family protein [Mucilaginibacter sabulilitoris]|uniref:TolC family protein n=1 Tax=Mucilaginibacter sabulilitoris TaxID=1173583 RepID=A0ABZ0TSQ6_9SPHI|nr:TolC family protein [Mucilaginibacter sabulilitoris]WPU96146.1 TolC family protein [Mucilaginibacter sabulilitoris]
MKLTIKFVLPLMVYFMWCTLSLKAQDVPTYSLEQLTDSALRNNHALVTKMWQIKEKQAKIEEDKIKRYPSTTLSGNYLHSFSLGELTIPAGLIGQSSPSTDKSFTVGQNNSSVIGIMAYQPITQQAKIKTGVEVAKTDVLLTEKDRLKITLQIKQTVEQLYYGILITQKRLEEADAALALAKSKLQDVENALRAGKTVTADKAGLQANIADEEQNILKLNIQVQDYTGDLITITGIIATDIKLKEIEPDIPAMQTVEEYQNAAKNSNVDLQIANLNKSKAVLSIKSSRQSNIPELGLIGGYAHQFGNALLPVNNTYVGLSLKWDLQSIFSNKQITRQRRFGLKQAEENFINTELQVSNDIKKAHRKVNQAQALVAAAQKAVSYRQEELKIQDDKQAAGLNKSADLLNTKALLAKARADMYSAQLSYRMAVSDLKILAGQ